MKTSEIEWHNLNVCLLCEILLRNIIVQCFCGEPTPVLHGKQILECYQRFWKNCLGLKQNMHLNGCQLYVDFRYSWASMVPIPTNGRVHCQS